MLSGVLKLKIETGRYTNLTRNQRICDLCNNGIEDEIHFIFQCPKYALSRHMLEKKIDKNLCNQTKLKILLHKDNVHMLANHIYDALYKRNHLIAEL